MRKNIAKTGWLLFGVVLAANASENNASLPVTISLASVHLDKEIPESIRREFDDDDGRPIRSVSIDLNSDYRPEKLIPNEFLCGNGGCPWLIYDQKNNTVIGRVFGSAVRILDETSNGYQVIETNYRLGSEVIESKTYRFRNGAYEESK